MIIDTLQKKLALAVSILSLIALVWGGYKWGMSTVKAWAQEQVQQTVGDKLDAQGELLERIACAAVYEKPPAVCDCEAFERTQEKPDFTRCETVAKLLEAGRTQEAAAVAADSTK